MRRRVAPRRNVVHDELAPSGSCNSGPGSERDCAPLAIARASGMRAGGARTLVGVQSATLNKSADQECIFLFSRDVFLLSLSLSSFLSPQ